MALGDETLVASIEDQAGTVFNQNPKETDQVRRNEKEASDPTQTQLKRGKQHT
jgi:hypothetical protein